MESCDGNEYFGATSADSEIAEEAETRSDSWRDVRDFCFRFFVLLKDGFVKFIIVVFLIYLSIRVCLVENGVELQKGEFT